MKSYTNRRTFIQRTGTGIAGLAAGLTLNRGRLEASKKPNILFIAVDDLRPELGCYGRGQIKSPNIDRLAENGAVFERAYCQVPVCGASRASLLTGVRPTRHRFIDYYTKVDDDLPGALTLPGHFKNGGWHTVSNGKIFHHGNDCLTSWSETPWHPKPKRGSWRNYQLEDNLAIDEEGTTRGSAYECADVPDNAYFDGMICDKSLNDMRRLAKTGQPFFLAAGFMKPHLPFNAPKKYWDMYRFEDIDPASNPFRPQGAPDAAMHKFGELRRYYGIPEDGPLSEELSRKLIHGYYASVSCSDAQIGRLLDELDSLGIRDNTIVVLWGDHGWQLGEHGLWCKHCNFENALHSPLIVSAPGYGHAVRTNALVEFVDIYPTLCDLAGLETPSHLEGKSLLPLLDNPDRAWKNAAFSRYYNGDSVKTDRYRYTEWVREKTEPGDPMELEQYARMLYDHKVDPAENVNIAERPENAELATGLSRLLKEGWEPVNR